MQVLGFKSVSETVRNDSNRNCAWFSVTGHSQQFNSVTGFLRSEYRLGSLTKGPICVNGKGGVISD